MIPHIVGVWVLTFVGIGFGSHSVDRHDWRAIGQADGAQVLRAAVALHQPGLDRARARLDEISNPASSSFGQYLNSSETTTLFRPDHLSVHLALEWLAAHGIENAHLRRSNALLEFNATVDQLQDLLGARYQVFEHRQAREQRIGTDDYRIPLHLREHVQFVTPTTDLVATVSNRKKVLKREAPSYGPAAVNLTDCHYSWTPECIRKLYGIPVDHEIAPQNSLGIFGTLDDFSQSDLNTFWLKFAPFIRNGTAPNVKRIDNNPVGNEETIGEMILDMTMAYPIVYPQTVDLYYVDDTAAGNYQGLANHFLDAIDATYCAYDGGDDPKLDPHYPDVNDLFPDGGASVGLYNGTRQCGIYKPNNVISFSYGVDEYPLGEHYVQRQCNEWMKLALQGVTVVVASGDRGVQGNMGCLPNNASSSADKFNPGFPASCPYVTTVGATQVNFDGQGYDEVAVFDPKHAFYSGGGFSNFNPQPDYQKRTVQQYLAQYGPNYPNGTFNAAGRAFPDVALLGANVTLVDGSEVTVSGGTSAATPTFAAMINRINDERLLMGKGPIGFLNQILYQHPEVFTDITQGTNPGCRTQGFRAAKGWDPVSGLGSPVFPKLRDLLVGLP